MNSAKAKTIAFILPNLTAGGAERVLLTLMNNISQEKFNPHFIALSGKGPLKGWINPDIPSRFLNHNNMILGYLPLLRELKRLRPDIVVTTLTHMNFLALLLKPFFPQVKFIIREPNIPSSMLNPYPWPKRMLVRWGYKILYPHADMIISPARCIVEEFKKLLGLHTARFFVLYNPVDTGRMNLLNLPKRDAGSKTVHFTCAGRLHYQKGFDRLIGHLGKFEMPGGLDWRLTIIGEGEEEAALKSLVKDCNLADHIAFKGLVDDPWSHMSKADCFLLPSRWEGLPNVVLESLACGTPVIAMKEAGGIGEIAEETNRIHPDAVRIAGTIDEFVNFMSRVQPVTGSRQSFLSEKFSLQKAVSEFENLLEEGLKNA